MKYGSIFPLQEIGFPADRQEGWMHLIGQEAIEVFEGTGSGWHSDITTHPFWQLNVNIGEDPIKTKLLVAQTEGGNLFTAVASLDSEIPWQELEKWEEAVVRAKQKSEKQGEFFLWAAYIGQVPGPVGRRTVNLSGSLKLGDISFTSAQKILFERSPITHPSLFAHSLACTVPIKVEGKSRGHNWQQAELPALKELNRLSVILTLAWDVLIDVRERPLPRIMGEISLPESPSWILPMEDDLSELRDIEKVDPAVVEFPDWGRQAWNTLKKEAKMEYASASYMEGMRIRDSHPSLAVVAFVATIEAIAGKIFKEKRCDSCGNHRDITKMFRATIRLATDDESTIGRISGVYSKRSKTVHTGRLHGTEGTSGIAEMLMLSASPEDIFRSHTVHEIQQVSRTLLKKGLTKDLPSVGKVPIDD